MTTIGSVGTGLTGNLARPASDGRFDPGEGVRMTVRETDGGRSGRGSGPSSCAAAQ